MIRILPLKFGQRRAVSTMIGGIIILTLLMTALGTMVFVSQEYDSYQTTVNKMSQKDIDRFSENLQAIYPGVQTPSTVPCTGGTGGNCKKYIVPINNLAGIGTQIARVYIASASPNSLCPSPPEPAAGFCAVDSYTPTGSQPAKVFTFSSSSSFINPSESNHQLIFWLDSATQLASGSFTLVTTRGREFVFQFPFPTTPNPFVGGLTLGCISINFEQNLITYTDPVRTIPQLPIGGTLTGGWRLPYNTYVMLFARIQNVCAATVKLLDKSVFYVTQYTGSASPVPYYISAPMTPSYCQYFPPLQGQTVYCVPNGINTYPGSNGAVNGYNSSLAGCSASNPCYELPPAPPQGAPSQVAYVVFSSSDYCKDSSTKCATTTKFSTGTNLYLVLLAIYWQCETTASGCLQNYQFGVTLPFVTLVTVDPSIQS
jgi:hypothetical protein